MSAVLGQIVGVRVTVQVGIVIHGTTAVALLAEAIFYRVCAAGVFTRNILKIKK